MRTLAAARLLAFAAVAIASSSPLIAQQAHINLDWAPHRASGSLVPFMANVISPEVSDQRMVTFRVKAPRAEEVQLAARARLPRRSAARHRPGRSRRALTARGR